MHDIHTQLPHQANERAADLSRRQTAEKRDLQMLKAKFSDALYHWTRL